ncbi:hypothetical protein HPAKL86_07224 (plasmid) [Helicobacter pylori Aklavik86]|uniref:Uncharacterized protein n=1 Tax=Helicobacter pylori Aklavik86 TaxID=1055532 RepID=K7Y9P7_HELPX|nr:hypothetical protein HPAKL86_07224 [Helicobacter pylori Aklavik86]
MDKSASQFEIVGVSRRWFCDSKIKQDSANLAHSTKFLKTKNPKICSASCALFLLHVLNSMLFFTCFTRMRACEGLGVRTA